jgi:transposase
MSRPGRSSTCSRDATPLTCADGCETSAQAWLRNVEVVSVDPHEGYRSAVVSGPLAHATVVVDGFHIVRLANMAVTRVRQRVQTDTVGHPGLGR